MREQGLSLGSVGREQRGLCDRAAAIDGVIANERVIALGVIRRELANRRRRTGVGTFPHARQHFIADPRDRSALIDILTRRRDRRAVAGDLNYLGQGRFDMFALVFPIARELDGGNWFIAVVALDDE